MSVDVSVVTRVLSVIDSTPGLRSEPRRGDLRGEYDRWFDGGAIRIVTGWNEYHFSDDTVAIVPSSPILHVEIRLPTGAYVSVTEQSDPPPNFQLLAPYT
jgi:hypothetical protein